MCRCMVVGWYNVGAWRARGGTWLEFWGGISCGVESWRRGRRGWKPMIHTWMFFFFGFLHEGFLYLLEKNFFLFKRMKKKKHGSWWFAYSILFVYKQKNGGLRGCTDRLLSSNPHRSVAQYKIVGGRWLLGRYSGSWSSSVFRGFGIYVFLCFGGVGVILSGRWSTSSRYMEW